MAHARINSVGQHEDAEQFGCGVSIGPAAQAYAYAFHAEGCGALA